MNAILAALHHRQKTGKGQHIDVGLLDSHQISWLINQGTAYLMTGDVPGRMGNSLRTSYPTRHFTRPMGVHYRLRQ
jgi:crotonobetainyl-CoA:carnitine CoA-transferase CaiB-like acyl-CoA transferase